MDADAKAIWEGIEWQLETYGVAKYQATDGEVFVFTTPILQKLLNASEEPDAGGKALLFIHRGEVV